MGRENGPPGHKRTNYNIRMNAGSLVIELFGARYSYLGCLPKEGLGARGREGERERHLGR